MPLPPKNLLSDESSPYLLQHKDNPVHWRPWSRGALEEAQALDRPILLSVGYAACHWCHVMAHESFEDDRVAAVMNRLFINIKVDREERPEIDQIYMAALTATGEQGGWPLTMFLSPDGKPFWGGTYFPKEQRYGRAGFIDVLEAVYKAWQEKKADLTKSAEALSAHVQSQLSPLSTPARLSSETLQKLASKIHEMIDHEMGGLRGAPKFPNAPFMKVLWLNWLQNGVPEHRDAVIHSLRTMLSGGIYDHVGGGLARYATDDRWLVPHFEKMLYDNAQLIHMMSWIYGENGDDLFRMRIEETVGWLLRDMRVPDGAFAASLDADSEGEEGLFYLWRQAEIENILGKNDTNQLLQTFSLAQPEGWHGDPILHRLNNPHYLGADTESSLRAMLERLRSERDKRPAPGRDDKILVDWNGMAIAAVADASRLLDRPDWLEAAQTAFHFIGESMIEGRLPHSIRGAKMLFPALATDYAAMISAASSLYQSTGDEALRAQALQWVETLRTWHGDAEGAGFYLTASDSDDVPIRIRGDVDEATPSAASQIIEAMSKLASLGGDADFQKRLSEIVDAALGRAQKQAYGQVGLIYAASLTHQPIKLVMVEPKDPSLFVPVANRRLDPRRVDIVVRKDDQMQPLPGGAMVDPTKPAAYLCVGQSCSPPITTADELMQALRPDAIR